MTEHPRVLVIGSTGSIGRLVVGDLQANGVPTRALSRDGAKAERMLGDEVDVVQGDVTSPADLRAASIGVHAVVMTHGAPYGSGDAEAVDYGAGRRSSRRSSVARFGLCS